MLVYELNQRGRCSVQRRLLPHLLRALLQSHTSFKIRLIFRASKEPSGISNGTSSDGVP